LLRHVGDQLGSNAGRLDALSPLCQLARGYVIASRDPDGRHPANFRELAVGGQLWLRFSQGRARTRIEDVSE
jgi:exonuclease VII large subunit